MHFCSFVNLFLYKPGQRFIGVRRQQSVDIYFPRVGPTLGAVEPHWILPHAAVCIVYPGQGLTLLQEFATRKVLQKIKLVKLQQVRQCSISESIVSAGEIWTLCDCWAQVMFSWRHTLYWDIEVTGIRRDDLDKDWSAVTKCLKIINSVCTSRRKKKSWKMPMLQVFIYYYQSLKSSNVCKTLSLSQTLYYRTHPISSDKAPLNFFLYLIFFLMSDESFHFSSGHWSKLIIC